MPKRKQKLKVYSTPIGFHDALVAAPSQKAALEAWGASTNLFKQGSAHVVTDERLAKVPLENPGRVVKVARGTHAEQLAALASQERPRRKSEPEPEIIPSRAMRPRKRPSRAMLQRAEDAVDRLKTRQSEQLKGLERQMKLLEQKLRDLQRRHERELEKAQARADDERDKYQDAVERYEAG